MDFIRLYNEFFRCCISEYELRFLESNFLFLGMVLRICCFLFNLGLNGLFTSRQLISSIRSVLVGDRCTNVSFPTTVSLTEWPSSKGIQFYLPP